MAKAKKEVNKSQAIRDVLNSKRGIKPQAAVKILATQGIETTAAYVSTIKSNMNRKGAAGASPAGPGRPPKSSSAGDKFSLETLVDAKKMAAKLGGVDKAKAALDALAKLQA